MQRGAISVTLNPGSDPTRRLTPAARSAGSPTAPNGSSSPARQLRSVDLPLPDGPSTATISPASTVRLTPLRASVSSFWTSSRELGAFHVLVGPNASCKTTFLDVIAFLRDVTCEGLDAALANRTTNPEELLFRRQGDRLELAIETFIPEKKRSLTAKPALDRARYEMVIGFDETKRQFELKAEKFLLKKSGPMEPRQRTLFPMSHEAPDSLVTPKGGRGIKVVVNKVPGGNDNFYSETYGQSGKGWAPSFKLGPQKSALGNLPADESSFPVAMWFREFLTVGVQRFILNSLKIKQPSPPTKVKGFLPDGSNLPWVVAGLRRAEDHSRKISGGRTFIVEWDGDPRVLLQQ